MSKSIFLSAKWEHLIFVNFEIDPELLTPHIPTGTKLDFFNDKTYISLVAFLFSDTKAMGFIPAFFHRHFEEINLRFYVLREEKGHIKRGVVFIKEIISKPFIAWLANHLYYENYITMPTLHHLDIGNHYKYQWDASSIAVHSNGNLLEIENNSFERWITEHYWGYTQVNSGKTIEYEVKHPVWNLYEVTDHKLSIDFSKSFGKKYRPYIQNEPSSILLAQGSKVTVHWPQILMVSGIS